MVTMEMGEGPAVLLVHGLNGFKEGWGRLPAALAGAGHRVVAVDLPGFGETPPLRERATPEALARALAPLVAELAPVGLVAHSLGTQLAMLLALQQPDRVRATALIAPWVTPRTRRRRPRGVADLLQLPLVGRALGRVAIRGIRRTPERRRWAFLSVVAEPDRSDAELEALLQAAADRLLMADARTIADWAASGIGDDLRPLVGRIGAPSLVVAGEADRLTPAGDAAWLAGALPAGRALRVPRAGHFPHIERPEVVMPAIVEHMA